MQSSGEVGWRGEKDIGWGKGATGERVPTGAEAGLTLLAAEMGKPSGKTYAAFIGGSVDPGGGGKSPPGTRTPD